MHTLPSTDRPNPARNTFVFPIPAEPTRLAIPQEWKDKAANELVAAIGTPQRSNIAPHRRMLSEQGFSWQEPAMGDRYISKAIACPVLRRVCDRLKQQPREPLPTTVFRTMNGQLPPSPAASIPVWVSTLLAGHS